MTAHSLLFEAHDSSCQTSNCTEPTWMGRFGKSTSSRARRFPFNFCTARGRPIRDPCFLMHLAHRHTQPRGCQATSKGQRGVDERWGVPVVNFFFPMLASSERSWGGGRCQSYFAVRAGVSDLGTTFPVASSLYLRRSKRKGVETCGGPLSGDDIFADGTAVRNCQAPNVVALLIWPRLILGFSYFPFWRDASTTFWLPKLLNASC